ncbi:MAG: ABC transporter permease [Acidobacteriota bacterium]
MIAKIKEIFRYKDLIRNLVIRDLKVKYKNSVLGYLWSLVDPLLTALLFIIIFSIIVRLQVENYPVFLLTALLPWGFFQSSLLGAVISISGNSNLIKKVYFPREIFPLSSILSNLINFCLSLLVFVPLILILRVKLSWALLWLPVVIVVQVLFTGGLSLFVAHLNVFFNDIAFLLKFALNLLFYATPIFYPLEMVPQRFLGIYLLNPMAVLVSIYRKVIMNLPLPPLRFVFVAIALSMGIMVGGLIFFHRRENAMVKRV